MRRAQKGREEVEIGHGERGHKVEIERGRAIAQHVGRVVENLPAGKADAACVWRIPRLHPHVCCRKAVGPVLLLVNRGTALAVDGGKGCAKGGDRKHHGAGRAKRVHVPVEGEREVDHPTLGCGLVGAPCRIAVTLCFESPALVLALQLVGRSSIAGSAHEAHTWDAQFKCFGRFIRGNALNAVDKMLSLEYGLPRGWIVCKRYHMTA